MAVIALGIVAAGLTFTQLANASPISYSLGNGGTTLHRFGVANPGAASSISLSGPLDAIDFRPSTGQLYGYVDATDQYYTVNPLTGQLTLATNSPIAPTASDKLGIDFNPTIDRLRAVTELEENIVYNPTTATAAAVTNLFYVSGDANFGANPNVTGNAYTNSFAGATSTTQYVLDSGLNVLAQLGNNTGELRTVGEVTLGGVSLDFAADTGFDIFFRDGVNTAYAMLNVSSQSGIYAIDLTTAQATFLGALPSNAGTARGLAITPVPEPGSVALMLGGFAALLAVRRRAQQ
jgi:hypothetical protein